MMKEGTGIRDQQSGTSRGLRLRAHRRGIALMDAIIGAVILGVGLAVVISISSRALARQTDGERRTTAAWLADELLNMVIVEGPVDYPKAYDLTGRFDAPFQDFYYELNLDDQGLGLPFRVTAFVRWEAGARWNEATVQTLIAVHGGDPIMDQRAPLEPVDREARWHPDEQG